MRYFILALLACMALFTVAAAVVHAQAVDRGAAAATAEIDAGVPAHVAPALPSAELPTGDQVVQRPAESIDAITRARRTGGLWAAAAVIALLLSRAWIAYTAPPPGSTSPPPSGWRAKSLAVAVALAALAGTGVDVLLGPTPAIAFLTVGPTALMALIPVFNPVRGSARATA